MSSWGFSQNDGKSQSTEPDIGAQDQYDHSYNADATDPAQRLDLYQRMVDSALARQAIAPMWEVQTARLQQDNHDPDAGLTEEERDAKHGLGAAADAQGHRLSGEFRPITLDLNGDGQISTVSNAASDVSFDWDNSGFVKQTGWVSGADGFLVLDRNLNGTADTGKELFSNSNVADAAKGVRSLVWVDANADGKINADDPVFAALRVWQDANQDGVVDAGESHSLSDLGITELDYTNGRFTRNGQLYSLQSQQLDASDDGVRVNVVQGGLQVDYSNGHSTLFVTQVDNLGGGSGQGTSFTAQDDGITSWEDGTPPSSTPQQDSTHQPISITFAQLLANDAFNGSNTALSITAVGSNLHGTAVLNTTQGTVEFTPEHNYVGPASFVYTVTAPDGQTRTATAMIDLQAVNDAPVVTATLGQRAVYGYGVLSHTDSFGGEDSPPVISVQFNQGTPFYAPYNTVMGQSVTYVPDGSGEGSIPVFGPLVDTGIPKDYFDHQYAAYAANFNGGEDGAPPSSLTVALNGQAFLVQATPSLVLHATPIGTEVDNDGVVHATDPEGSTQFKYEVATDGLYGHATIDQSTGQFSYTGKRYVDQDVYGNPVGNNVVTDEHTRSDETHTDVFSVKVTAANTTHWRLAA